MPVPEDSGEILIRLDERTKVMAKDITDMKASHTEMGKQISNLERVDSEQAGAIKALKVIWLIGGAAVGLLVTLLKFWKDTP